MAISVVGFVARDEGRGQLHDELAGASGGHVHKDRGVDTLLLLLLVVLCTAPRRLTARAVDREQHAPAAAFPEQHRVTLPLDDDRSVEVCRKLPAMGHRHWQRPWRPIQLGDGQLLEQDHRHVAAAFGRRPVQRVSELLHLVSHALVFEGCDHHREAVCQPLALPGAPHALAQLAEREPEPDLVGVAFVRPYARTPVDAELPDGAVPRKADDVAGAARLGIAVSGVPHILPLRRVLCVGGLGLDTEPIEDAPALARREGARVVLEGLGRIADGDVHVERGNPQGSLGQQLIDGYREAAGACRVQLDRQRRRG